MSVIKLSFESIKHKLADPFTKSPIQEIDGRGWDLAFDDIVPHFRNREISFYKRVQRNGEKSYNERSIGNFSHDRYSPSIELGEKLAGFEGLFLDIGCGLLDAPIYMKLSSPPISYIGMDPIKSGNIEIYQSREFFFIQGFGEFLPFKENSLDGVVFSSTLDHQIRPEKSLSEAFRVLKPSGTLHIVETERRIDLNYIRWKIEKGIFGAAIYNHFHCQAFTRRRLLALVTAAGFTVLEIKHLDSSEIYIYAGKP